MTRAHLVALMAAVLESGDRSAEQTVDISRVVEPGYYVNRALDLLDVAEQHPGVRQRDIAATNRPAHA